MTIAELHTKLQDFGISQDRYYLQGIYGSSDSSDKLALEIRKGVQGIEYEVFYKERGEKSIIKIFTNEKEACNFFFDRIKDMSML